jgi:hypothetical protein
MKRGDFRMLATNWNYSGFASQIGPVPAPSTTRNAPGIERSAGPNIFAHPAPGSTIRMQVMPANAMAFAAMGSSPST